MDWINWLIGLGSWNALFNKQTPQVLRNVASWLAQCLVNLGDWLRSWISWSLDVINTWGLWSYNVVSGIWTNCLWPALTWIADGFERLEYLKERLRLGLHDTIRNLIDWAIRGGVVGADVALGGARFLTDKLLALAAVQQAIGDAVADGLVRLEQRGVGAVLSVRDKMNEGIAWLNFALRPEGLLREEILGFSCLAFQGTIVHQLLRVGIRENAGQIAQQLAARFPLRTTESARAAFITGATAQAEEFRQALARFAAQ